WETFREEPTGLASVQTQDYLRAGVAGQPAVQLAYGPVPTRSGEAVTVAETWAFVFLTQDATQRELALALAATLLTPTVQGPWSQYSGRLPSRSSALAAWTPAGDYVTFLDQQLHAAIAIPNGRAFADFARRLQTAQAAVLRGELTPEQAGRELGVAP
ncbi:MAG TPA: hypothetical protein VNK95_10625, partial [Caldilineaceae bacterium]|nr:hypothetical protein [Caldilineaceae bacterium]